MALLWIEYVKAAEPIQGDSLILTTKSPGTHHKAEVSLNIFPD